MNFNKIDLKDENIIHHSNESSKLPTYSRCDYCDKIKKCMPDLSTKFSEKFQSDFRRRPCLNISQDYCFLVKSIGTSRYKIIEYNRTTTQMRKHNIFFDHSCQGNKRGSSYSYTDQGKFIFTHSCEVFQILIFNDVVNGNKIEIINPPEFYDTVLFLNKDTVLALSDDSLNQLPHISLIQESQNHPYKKTYTYNQSVDWYQFCNLSNKLIIILEDQTIRIENLPNCSEHKK